MKKRLVSGSIILITLLCCVFYYFYFYKTVDYSFNTSYISNSKVIKNGKQLHEEIILLGFKNSIISSDNYSVELKLSKYQLNKILHSKKTKQYIESYQTVEEIKMQPGIVNGQSPLT